MNVYVVMRGYVGTSWPLAVYEDEFDAKYRVKQEEERAGSEFSYWTVAVGYVQCLPDADDYIGGVR